ncbi:hypothetical protein [Pseudoxanthomonas sp. z9]|uniref:hypothetical protein n=1 Tax=Pseudoxanthomonas sp. z9 TaxID=2584942 RepID=UPI001141290B|nr:hypothetical protein [Pseudoxanthomonas sp. z9]MCL6712155.1 hypothetical protein [Pseudomonas sp. R2.Fl]
MKRTALLFMLLCLAAQAGAQAPERPILRVMLIGNSQIYVNNLPGLLRSLARAQGDGPLLETGTYVMPGAELVHHWKNGAATKALEREHWDVVVLQERGGLLACIASPTQKEQDDCRNSLRTHRRFAELARTHGARVLLLGTWGPDADWQENLDRGLRHVARMTNATPVLSGTRLRAYQQAHRDLVLFTDDDLHPSLSASLIVTATLYREIAGRPAQAADLRLDFPLLPPGSPMGDNLPLEQNAALNALIRPIALSAAELPPLLEAAEPAP